MKRQRRKATRLKLRLARHWCARPNREEDDESESGLLCLGVADEPVTASNSSA
jgi:hypothetical protein